MRSFASVIVAAVGLVLAAGPTRAADVQTASTDVAAPLPPALTPAQQGRKLWLKLNCYGCHGMHAAGGMGPNVRGAESDDLNEVVMGGGEGGMPSFRAYLNPANPQGDITNLGAYLRTAGTSAEPTFLHWWEAYPTQ